MGNKRASESQDSLKFKLQVLHDYISQKERYARQLKIDIDLAILTRPPDFDTFDQDIVVALKKFLTAAPPLSLIKEDMIRDSPRIETAYATDPRVEKLREKFDRLGLDSGVFQEEEFWENESSSNLYFSLLASKTSEMYNDDPEKGREEIRAVMEFFLLVKDLLLERVRRLRRLWINDLAGKDESIHRKKAGRPPDEGVARRNRKMYEAWQTGHYENYAGLGAEFGVTADVRGRR